jgi:cytochrome c biogenesis protein CcmG/thiol:disulfide interchange protein DsbE
LNSPRTTTEHRRHHTGGNALRFLGELGNPYSAVGIDPTGTAAIDWDVWGIPESYLVALRGHHPL